MDEQKRLQRFKKYSGWTYQQITFMIPGIHQQSIVNWITNKCKPSPMAKEKLNDFFSIFEGLSKKEARKELRKRLP